MRHQVTMVSKFLDLNILFLTEMPICIVKQSKKGIGYRFVPECNNAEKHHTCQFFPFFPAILAEPQFVELQKFSDHEMAM